MKFSVIIPTMNRVSTLQETLDDILHSTVLPDEVIIVDQTVDTDVAKAIYDTLDSYTYNTKYFHLDEPSLTKARNFGIRQAANDWVVFMDDDTSVEPETFANMLSIMNSSKLALIAGINGNSSDSKNLFSVLFGTKSIRKKSLGCYVTSAMYGRFQNKIDKQMPVEWAMGYFFVIKKSLCELWNIYWEEKFIAYGYPEDLDFSFRYCKKASNDGYLCVVDPSVRVRHRVSNEWRMTSRTTTFMEVINREYITYKFKLPMRFRLATRWANLGEFLFRIIARDNPIDVLIAQYYCDKYRRDIKNGNLHTELYRKT